MTREERELMVAAVDGSLPSAAKERVRELLKHDGQALEMFAREALLHGELEWHFGARRRSQAALQRRAEVVGEVRRRQTKRLATASLGLAAAVLMVLAAAALLRSVPPRTVDLRFNEGAVSQLVRAAGNPEGPGPAPGDRLTLERGAVELTFPSGVRAVIEAPADMEFVEGNALKMDHGTGYFRIERPEAAGFEVILPESAVIDLGTSFGIIAPAAGPAEIHLIDGRVGLQRPTGTFQPARGLKPGEACREDDTSSSGFSRIPFRADRFARQLPDRHEHVAIDFDRIGGDGAFATSGPRRASVREVSVNNGSIRQVPGRIGNGIRFDGRGSHLRILGWAEHHHRPSGTLSFWVRMPEKPDIVRYCPVSWGSTERADVGRWSVAIEPGPQTAGLSIRAGMEKSYHLSAASRLDYSVWHHLAFVFGPEEAGHTKLRIFVDGNEEPSSIPVPVLSAPSPDEALVIGTHHDPDLWTSHAFSGDIDDLRIYRTALEGGAIAILARGRDPAKAESPHNRFAK